MTSERPEGLTPLELEEYELEIEDQSYPFEEKAIEVHESNLELISRGVYNDWIDRSLEKLAQIVPVRYDKPEESSDVVSSLETYIFAFARPAANVPPETTDSTVADQLKPPGPIGDVAPDEVDTTADTQADQPLPETNTEPEENVSVIVSDPRVETTADQSVSSGIVEAAREIQAAEPVTTNGLVLWVDEDAADESDVQEGYPEVKIP